MAEQEKVENQEAGNEEAEGEKSSSRFPIKLVGGVLALVTAGSMLAMVAVPKKGLPKLQGPFHTALIETPAPFSTRDANYSRYVKFGLDAEYRAYDEAYLAERSLDPFFATNLNSQIGRSATSKTVSEIAEGLNQELFAEELRGELEMIVFPLHIGDTKHPNDQDEQTGLRPGISVNMSGFRGRFFDHVLHFNGPEKTIQIDDGPVIEFSGHEEDLAVRTAEGNTVYIDVSLHKPEFVGDIQVGARGYLRRLILRNLIAG